MGAPAKDPGARRRYNQPARGEWVELPELDEFVLPAYPMAWYAPQIKPFSIAKWMWDLWRSDPVTSQWSPADLALALELGERYWRFKDGDRLRIITILGLNAKGRRDLRWRMPEEAKAIERTQTAEVRRLRIVNETPVEDD